MMYKKIKLEQGDFLMNDFVKLDNAKLVSELKEIVVSERNAVSFFGLSKRSQSAGRSSRAWIWEPV